MLVCPKCAQREEWLGPIFRKNVFCPQCGTERIPVMQHRIGRDAAFIDQPLATIGIAPGQIVRAKGSGTYAYFELSGDFPAILKFTTRRNPEKDRGL